MSGCCICQPRCGISIELEIWTVCGTYGVAFDDANNIVAGLVGEGNVGVPGDVSGQPRYLVAVDVLGEGHFGVQLVEKVAVEV